MILISCRLWFPWSYDKCISMWWWQNNRGWGSPWYCDKTLQGVPEGTADMIIMKSWIFTQSRCFLNEAGHSGEVIYMFFSFPPLHPPSIFLSQLPWQPFLVPPPSLHPLCPSLFHPPVLSLWVFIPHFGFSVISEQISCQGLNVVGLPNWLFC